MSGLDLVEDLVEIESLQPIEGNTGRESRERTLRLWGGGSSVVIQLGRSAARRGSDRKTLLDELEDLLGDVTDAWDRHLRSARKPAGGSWVLRIYLDAEGQVQKVEFVSDTLRSKDLRSLLEGDAVHWQLTGPEHETASNFEVKLTFGR